MAVNSVVVGLPSALTALVVTLIPWPAMAYTDICSFGAGPGVYLDFATLRAHVPMCGSACAKTAFERTTVKTPSRATTLTIPTESLLVLMCDSSDWPMVDTLTTGDGRA